MNRNTTKSVRNKMNAEGLIPSPEEATTADSRVLQTVQTLTMLQTAQTLTMYTFCVYNRFKSILYRVNTNTVALMSSTVALKVTCSQGYVGVCSGHSLFPEIKSGTCPPPTQYPSFLYSL